MKKLLLPLVLLLLANDTRRTGLPVLLRVKMRFAIVLAALALPSIAFAQQVTPQEIVQALQGKLQDEIAQDMQVRAELVKTKKELATAQKELAAMKDKKESK